MRNIKTIIMISIILSFFCATMASGAEVAKIGVVNSQEVFKSSKRGQKLAAELNKMGKQMEADLKKRKGEIDELKKSFESQAMVLSKEALEKKRRDIQVKTYDFRAEQEKYRSKLQTENQKKMSQFRKELLEVVKEIGKKEGYLLIVDHLTVLYNPGGTDLTDKVIKRFDAKFSN